MEITLKSKRKVKVKTVSLDERDSLLDGVKYIMKDLKVVGIFIVYIMVV